MKPKFWAIVKLAVIAGLTSSVVTYQVNTIQDAWSLGGGLALCLGILAVFQLAVWFFYDVITLKRGTWTLPSFGDNPFRRSRGLAFHLETQSVALLIFGAAKFVSAVFQGLPSLVLGLWLLAIGSFLLAWQRLLRRLFRPRFARSNGDPITPSHGGRMSHQSIQWNRSP